MTDPTLFGDTSGAAIGNDATGRIAGQFEALVAG